MSVFAPSTTPDPLDEMTKLHDKMNAFRRTGNIEELSLFFSEDGWFMSSFHPLVDKKDLMLLKKNNKFAPAVFKQELSTTPEDVQMFGDIAIDRGTVKIVFGEIGIKNGRYTQVWHMEEGSWKILNYNLCFPAELVPSKKENRQQDKQEQQDKQDKQEKISENKKDILENDIKKLVITDNPLRQKKI